MSKQLRLTSVKSLRDYPVMTTHTSMDALKKYQRVMRGRGYLMFTIDEVFV